MRLCWGSLNCASRAWQADSDICAFILHNLDMNDILFHNATVVNGGRRFHGFVAIKGELISAVGEGEPSPEMIEDSMETVDLKKKMIMPGVIDDQVHFREPGLTHKADMSSESRTALAGGVTSFMDMPNCKPPTVTVEAWRDKMERAEKSSAVNYAFWMGATNDNTEVLSGADYSKMRGAGCKPHCACDHPADHCKAGCQKRGVPGAALEWHCSQRGEAVRAQPDSPGDGSIYPDRGCPGGKPAGCMSDSL